MMPDLAVVYLARPAHGVEVFRRFVSAYRAQPAGVPHDLVVILKGFDADPGARAAYLELLTGLAYKTVEVADVRFDFGSYFSVAPGLEHEFIGFFNSHSEPLVAGWLAHLDRHARAAGVGLAGASASYQSHRTSFLESPSVGLEHMVPWPLRRLTRALPRTFTGPIARRFPYPPLPYREFAPYPNPHLRTNAFVVRRRLFVGLRDNPLREKWDAYRLESGPDSITRQVQRLGLKPVVVGGNGVAYDLPDWPHSFTFCNGNQDNVLVADNHTRQYAAADPAARARLARVTWGAAAVTTAEAV
jgi:hypothetical protein